MTEFRNLSTLIQLALLEDLSATDSLPTPVIRGDITAWATLDREQILHGVLIAKQHGVIAGLPVMAEVFRQVDERISFTPIAKDGDIVENRQVLAEVDGPGISILVAERTALNFIGRLSGIASMTRQFMNALVGTQTVMLDTRKTLPGFRELDKYAVRMGGGRNHRMALYDQAMIKDNHIAAVGSITLAVERVRAENGVDVPIILEVTHLDQLREALPLGVTRILLDNMNLETLRECVNLRNILHPEIPLEASGNVRLDTVRPIAETGVEYISSGALTHSPKVFDMSLEIE
ncbi:MAG TPA: carboxylating nicotinate-nucleotide diphosphorylase [Anaerolineales bacterium]|nr:carboxylating nicotinate-nucleotide diphosphorylase [Anaerolineales bacterium]